MSLNPYTLIHDNLSKTDKELLLQWVVLARLKYKNVLNMSFKQLIFSIVNILFKIILNRLAG